jgi:hypothetical protein
MQVGLRAPHQHHHHPGAARHPPAGHRRLGLYEGEPGAHGGIVAVNKVPIPFTTARDYIEKLVRVKVLREITGYARNRIFQSDEIVEAVQGMDAG